MKYVGVHNFVFQLRCISFKLLLNGFAGLLSQTLSAFLNDELCTLYCMPHASPLR